MGSSFKRGNKNMRKDGHLWRKLLFVYKHSLVGEFPISTKKIKTKTLKKEKVYKPKISLFLQNLIKKENNFIDYLKRQTALTG